MSRLACLTLLLTASLLHAQTPSKHQVRLNGQTFTLPVGFTIELAAKAPLVNRPISADFDEQGRLYVSDSSGSNEKVSVQLQKKPHRIVRLEDANGDGVFDRSTVFADKMMFPEGTMWRDGSLYVAAPPQIWKLTDTDGDGTADRRDVWFDGKTLTGCANDLHGPYRGPDGWIYWCKGAFAPQTYTLPGRKNFRTRAAHVFRARPDGSGVEPVMTGGMDNPVDLVFMPTGERFFTTTFLQFPAGGRRDGIIHAVYGGIYGKDWDVLRDADHLWTGPHLMPVLTHLGPAAPCGLHRYQGSAFGPAYRDNLFACLFNLQKVTRHILVPSGATFTTRDEDFLVSESKDFHPTDVIEDADGSLIVIDTGGWYKLCCPTSQLVKPDVLGAVYRIRKTGAAQIADPRGLRLDWKTANPAQLAERLDDVRPAVRRRAIETMAARGAVALPALQQVVRDGKTAQVRRNAVWTATRIDDEKARAIARLALTDRDASVVQTALHAVAVWRDRAAARAVTDVLTSTRQPATQRVAAEALGRILAGAGSAGEDPDVPVAVAALLDALGKGDHVLRHSLTYALIEIDAPAATARGLASPQPAIRRAALTALDQMAHGGRQSGRVVRELTAADPALRETAWWIASRHPEWADALRPALRGRLTAGLPESERDELAGQLAKLATAPAIQALLADLLRDDTVPAAGRQVVLRAMARAHVRQAPADWLSALQKRLAADDGAALLEALRTVRALRLPRAVPPELVKRLRSVGASKERDALARLTALAALPGGVGRVDAALFAFLREQLAAETPAAQRGLAAEILARARLDVGQLRTLAGQLPSVGPLEVQRVLDTFADTKDDAVGRALLRALDAPALKATLHADRMRGLIVHFGPQIRREAEPLLQALNVDAGKQKARLEELFARIKDGDVRRGQAVFNNPKVACVSCHSIGYLGGKVGPDLTRIGSIRTERDLLEAIVFPSASFVRGYEPVAVVTRAGQIHTGLIRQDSADTLVLATGVDQEVRIPRAQIEEIQPARVSIMPAGLDGQLTVQQLADLVAFLRACR